MLHALKERKRTMRSERKRTLCPTLVHRQLCAWEQAVKEMEYWLVEGRTKIDLLKILYLCEDDYKCGR